MEVLNNVTQKALLWSLNIIGSLVLVIVSIYTGSFNESIQEVKQDQKELKEKVNEVVVHMQEISMAQQFMLEDIRENKDKLSKINQNGKKGF